MAILLGLVAGEMRAQEVRSIRAEDICREPRFSSTAKAEPPAPGPAAAVPTVWPLALFQGFDEHDPDPSSMRSPVSVGAYTFDAFGSRRLRIPSDYLAEEDPSPSGLRILAYLGDTFQRFDLLPLADEPSNSTLAEVVSGRNLMVPLQDDGSIDQRILLGGSLPAGRTLPPSEFRACALLPAFKIDPLIDRGDELVLRLYGEETVEGVKQLIEAGGGEWLDRADASESTFRFRVAVPQTIYELARRRDVVAIERNEEIELRHRGTAGVLQSGDPERTTIFDRELKGLGQTVGIVDSPFDPRHCFFADPAYPPGIYHRKIRRYFGNLPDVPSAMTPHGTLVSGIAVGKDPLDPDDLKNGQAPEAKLVFTDLGEIQPLGSAKKSLFDALEEQYQADARVFSLSWGDDLCGRRMLARSVARRTCPVTSLGRDIDRFSRRYEDALVIVAVSNGEKVTSPENALNSLAVGASGQSGGVYPGGVSQDRWGRGGSGPTIGGRRKPELFVPGCHVVSARAGTPCDLAPASGARGHDGSVLMECATSWAAPAAAGAAALVRQYYTKGWYPTGMSAPIYACPTTGALVKATLLNATVDMVPDGYPSPVEGWGRLQLDDALYFSGEDRKLFAVDIENDDRAYAFIKNHQTTTYDFTVQDPKGTPVKVTLAWTQPAYRWTPSPIGNDLDLVVVKKRATPGGTDTFYCGNDLDTAGGNPPRTGCNLVRDRRNNVEQVWLPLAPMGSYEIRIGARWLNPYFRQGYALVASGSLVPAVANPKCAGAAPVP